VIDVWDIPERGDAVLVTRAGNTLYSYRTADEDREGQRSRLRPPAPLPSRAPRVPSGVVSDEAGEPVDALLLKPTSAVERMEAPRPPARARGRCRGVGAALGGFAARRWKCLGYGQGWSA
jgi:hypothetical protein